MTPLRRSVRLIAIRDHLRSRRAGMTPRELARVTGVSVRSIQRDLNAIQFDMGTALTVTGGRYAVPADERLPALDLTLQEARAMLIATRLYLRYSDESDPSAVNALQKLARIMPPDVRGQVQAAADSLSKRPFDPELNRNLTTVTEAWSRRRVLKLSYRSAGKQRSKEVIIEPYFLEPSAAGFSTYLIGYSRTHQQMRTLKVERIASAEKLPESFELAPDADLDQLLESAWGIIWGEGVLVRLRFAPAVTWRVKESRWHPSQTIEDLADGGCILTLNVASLMELGRWVRGWGDAVEVLSPESLRQELREEAVRVARTHRQAKASMAFGARRPKTARTLRVPKQGAAAKAPLIDDAPSTLPSG